MLVRFQPGIPESGQAPQTFFEKKVWKRNLVWNKKQAHVLFFCSEFLFSVGIAERFVFFVDVGFASVDVVVASFDGGDVDREGAVEGGEATGAFLDG